MVKIMPVKVKAVSSLFRAVVVVTLVNTRVFKLARAAGDQLAAVLKLASVPPAQVALLIPTAA